MYSEIKILLVEDTEITRRVISEMLNHLGYLNIESCENGKKALEILLEAKQTKPSFQLILCDWNMPKMSGLELLKKIQKEDGLKKIPFVMLTSTSEKEKVLEAIKAGVVHYLVKPFSLESLQNKLIEALKKNTKAA